MSETGMAMQAAVRLAGEVYSALLSEVVDDRVLVDRVGGPLAEKKRKAVAAGKQIDTRPVRLMAISGKGGYHPDPDLNAKYRESTNISLLDHLLSVVRGALTCCALEVMQEQADEPGDPDELRRDLRLLAALAFMHDVDKDLQLPRNTALETGMIDERWRRYGLDVFTDHALDAEQVRFLIEQAEASQAYRSPPSSPLPRRLRHLKDYMSYVALADKLDGLWLQEGADAVLARLRDDQTLRTDILRNWTVVDLYDPHHPFLVDELQRALSGSCKGMPPLFEVHQDGRLVVLLPARQAAAIRERALGRFVKVVHRRLFGLRVNISNRGLPELLDSRPDHVQLAEFLADEIPPRDLAALFRVKRELAADELTACLDELLGSYGLGPRWPKGTSATLSIYADPSQLEPLARQMLGQAAHLVLLLNHKAVTAWLDYDEREAALLALAERERPAWLRDIADAASRRILTGLWMTTLAQDDPELQANLFSREGLLQRWLEGDDHRQGLAASIQTQGENILAAVRDYFAARMQGQASLPDTGHTHHCLFTGLPVSADATFKEADKLYEVKVSAFSGRDGRLEDIGASGGETHISPVSYAEYRLRQVVHDSAGGKPSGIPTLLSVPATTGLFAALTFNNESNFSTFSTYDLSREQTGKGRVYDKADVYRHRYRIARFERIGERFTDQIEQLQLLLKASLRLGRPVHLFRGLPTATRDFFYFDALPERLAALLGRRGLRLEQIPAALERLRTAQLLLESPGLGYEILDRYLRPKTRLGAVCLAWCQLRDAEYYHAVARFRNEYDQLTQEYIRMNTDQAPLVALGHAAAGIQRYPGKLASASEELLVFNLALETAIGCWRMGQRDTESMAMAIAGELETNLTRKSKAAARENRNGQALLEGCLSFARQFVTEVWQPVLHGRPPAQTNRRILASIYRMAFLTAPRHKDDTPETPTPNHDEA